MSTPPYSSECKDPVVREVQEIPKCHIGGAATPTLSEHGPAG